MSEYEIEYPELANGLYLALKHDGFYRALENAVTGSAADKKKAMLKYMDYSIVESQEFGECYIPDDLQYGVSIWSYPLLEAQQQEKEESKIQFIRQQMGEECERCYQAMCQFMSSKAKPVTHAEDWYLSIIGIIPDYQGQGLGPGLVEKVLQKTDTLGLATYLETFTARNKSFYQRLGYRDVGEFHEPTSNATYWLMRRKPGSS